MQRWLDGNGIKAETAAYVAEALSGKLGRRVTPADLGFPTTSAKALATGGPYAATVSEVLGILDGLTQLAPGDESARAEKLTDVDVNSAVLSWMVSRPDGLTTDVAGARRVGMRDVLAIRTAAEMFARLDFLYGGGHGHTALRHYFRHEVLPLLSASYSEKVGTVLFAAAAEITEVLGWTAYDIGNHASAVHPLRGGLSAGNQQLLLRAGRRHLQRESGCRPRRVGGVEAQHARISTDASHVARDRPGVRQAAPAPLRRCAAPR